MNRIKFILILLTVTLFNYSAAAEDVVTQVVPIMRVAPELPKGMNANNIEEGFVTIKFEITEKGAVENPYVIESKPAKLYDRVALAAILKFKFKPHTVNGKPVRITATQTIEFEGNNDRQFDAGYDLKKYSGDEISIRLNRFKRDHDYKSTMVVTEKASGQTIKKLIMPDSDVDWGLMAGSPSSPYVFYYHSTSKKKAKVKIYNRLGLELLHDIDVPHAAQTKSGPGYDIFFTHKNDSELMALVGKKQPKLISIDGPTGKITEYDTELDKNSLVVSSHDGKYIWARKVSTVKDKVIKTTMKIIDTDDFSVIKEIPIRTKVKDIHYINGILEITYEYESNEPTFRRMFLRLSDLEYIGDFKTTKHSAFAHDIGENKAWVVLGVAEDGEHLKVAKLEEGVFTLLTDNEYKVGDYNLAEVNRTVGDESLIIHADKKFVEFNIFNPENRVELAVPFNVAGAYANADHSKFYLTEKHGSALALADITEQKIIATDKSRFGGLKFGQQHPNVLKNLTIKVPDSYDTSYAGKSFKDTDNIIILNNDSERVFVLRINTSYVTSFDAKDLSDEQLINTGRNTFQLAQKNHDPDNPILAIGISQITFIDPHTGELISQHKYDGVDRITPYDELVFWQDRKQQRISLDKLMNDAKK